LAAVKLSPVTAAPAVALSTLPGVGVNVSVGAPTVIAYARVPVYGPVPVLLSVAASVKL